MGQPPNVRSASCSEHRGLSDWQPGFTPITEARSVAGDHSAALPICGLLLHVYRSSRSDLARDSCQVPDHPPNPHAVQQCMAGTGIHHGLRAWTATLGGRIRHPEIEKPIIESTMNLIGIQDFHAGRSIGRKSLFVVGVLLGVLLLLACPKCFSAMVQISSAAARGISDAELEIT